MTDRPRPPGSRALFWAAALLWLPAGVVASAAIRFGPTAVSSGDLLTAMALASSSLVVASVCGLPLALACRRLGRLGHPRLAWIGGAALGVATVAALWVIAWRLAAYSARLANDEAVTDALLVPLAPLGWFAAAMAALSGLLAVVRLVTPSGGSAS